MRSATPAILFSFTPDTNERIDRDGKLHPREDARRSVDRGVDADQPFRGIHEWPARVSRADDRIRLHDTGRCQMPLLTGQPRKSIAPPQSSG